MENKDFSNIGEQIRDSVDEAMKSMNFGQLNRDITRTVTEALNEVKDSFAPFGGYRKPFVPPHVEPYSKYDRPQGGQAGAGSRTQEAYRGGSAQSAGGYASGGNPAWGQQARADGRTTGRRADAAGTQMKYRKEKGMVVPADRFRPVGRISGILMTVFGAVGLGSFGIADIVLLLSLLVTSEWTGGLFVVPLVLLSLFTVGSAVLLGNGIAKRKSWRRLTRCAQIIQSRSFCQVQELAAKLHLSEKETVKELRKMIQRGQLPTGHLDEKGTCLMLDDATYNQYLQAQQAWRQREEEKRQEAQRQAGEEKQNRRSKKEESGREEALPPEVAEMVRDGQRYIAQIREANDAIPGEVISGKLDRLERIISKIFESVRRHPEQADGMKKFMEYYLPTTGKLVDAYREFDGLPSKGENVTTAMNEIEKTLDTIILAFEKLLDDLFQDAAFDVSADISVLETMFAREGYKEKDFER